MGEFLDIWSEVTGKETEYLQVSLEEYDRLWPMWGMEVGMNLRIWDEFRAECWGSEKWIGREELGLEEGLVGIREAIVTLEKRSET